MDNVSALAIGAGLGFLAGWLLTGSNSSNRTQRNSGARSWSGGGQSARPVVSTGTSDVPIEETTDLIASNKVERTPVYDREGNKLGQVENFMVGKRSGRVAYAVLSFGGLLGVGTSHYPLPWRVLNYDTEKGGYVVDITKDRLNDAPSHRSYENAFEQPDYGRRVSEHWSSVGAAGL
jgi:hypothetical protein